MRFERFDIVRMSGLPRNPKTNWRACANSLLNSFKPTTDSNLEGKRFKTSESRFLRAKTTKTARTAIATATKINVLLRCAIVCASNLVILPAKAEIADLG
jgi:hypothetical protein